ncbi:MAG: CoA ester lyase [Rhodospirillales bacterium]|nr:CoA ester lyase [Rhodospirillales bacterium]
MKDNLIWRSMLYVPANKPAFVAKAHSRGADALILDLEDSVPMGERAAARAGLAAAASEAGQAGADILVRINRPLDEAVRDIEAAVMPDVIGLYLPKIESAEHLRLLEELIVKRELAQGMAPGTTLLVPMIETAGAYFRMDEIARSSTRNVAITLGGEDFALDTGMVPDEETLFLGSQKLVYAARAAGIIPLGTIGTVADYQDLDAYRASAKKSQKFGFEGSACIHPSVVPLLNEEFSPSAAEVARAERIVSVYQQAQADGTGAIALDGKMVDVPVALRAEKLLARHRRITQKTG